MTLEIRRPEPLISVGQKVVLITRNKKDYLAVKYGSVGIVRERLHGDSYSVEFPDGTIVIGAEDLYQFVMDPEKRDFPDLVRVHVNPDGPNTTEKVHPATCAHDWREIKEDPDYRCCIKCWEIIFSTRKLLSSRRDNLRRDKVERLSDYVKTVCPVYQLHPGTRDSKGNLIGVETDWLDYLQAIVQILKLEDYELVWVKLDDGTEPYLAIPTKMLEKQEDPLICVGKAILTKNYNSEFSYNNDKNSVARILTSRWIEKSKELEYHREEDNLSFLEEYRLRGDILFDRTNHRLYCVPEADDRIIKKVLAPEEGPPFGYSYYHMKDFINRLEESILDELPPSEDYDIFDKKRFFVSTNDDYHMVYRDDASEKVVARFSKDCYDCEDTDNKFIFRLKYDEDKEEE